MDEKRDRNAPDSSPLLAAPQREQNAADLVKAAPHLPQNRGIELSLSFFDGSKYNPIRCRNCFVFEGSGGDGVGVVDATISRYMNTDWWGIGPSTLAQWAGAVVTFGAVLVALFKDSIIAWKRKPKLVAMCTKETPFTVKTPLIAQGNVPVHGNVTWTGNGYYVRLKVENKGRSRAEKVQVSAEAITRRGSHDQFSLIPTILPLNLKWANIGSAILDGISPKMSSFCDVIVLCDPTNPLQRRPANTPTTVTIGELQLEVAPFTDWYLLSPGTYRLTLRIAAANVEPIDKVIEFTHSGTWTNDDIAMRRDHLGVSLK